VGIRCADHATFSIRKKLALTSPTSGCRSVGIVPSRTEATEFFLFVFELQPIYCSLIFGSFLIDYSTLPITDTRSAPKDLLIGYNSKHSRVDPLKLLSRHLFGGTHVYHKELHSRTIVAFGRSCVRST
jgi:hypothetical protein